MPEPIQPGEPASSSSATELRGSARALVLFDVCEEIRLDMLPGYSQNRAVVAQPKVGAPAAPRFERPPVVENLETVSMIRGEKLGGHIRYYDYGVIGVEYELPFRGQWPDFVALAIRWLENPQFEEHAKAAVKDRMPWAGAAVVNPHTPWLSEDYFVFHVLSGQRSATELMAQCGADIARIVRGERGELSDSERSEVLQSSLSYYRNDLAVVGWNAAFLYDTMEGAEAALQMLDYANSQLLEFRYYDEFLSRELRRVYAALGKRRRFAGWRMGRRASRLQRILVEVEELTERADNAIKFVSDMFSARMYHMAATKVGVPDYQGLVSQKLRDAGDLYRYMMDEYHQSRGFFLEAIVVIILLIELFYLLRGRG